MRLSRVGLSRWGSGWVRSRGKHSARLLLIPIVGIAGIGWSGDSCSPEHQHHLATETRAGASPHDKYACSALGTLGARATIWSLVAHVHSFPSLSLNPSNWHLALMLLVPSILTTKSSMTSPWHTKCSSISTPSSVFSRQHFSARCSGHMGRFEHAHTWLLA